MIGHFLLFACQLNDSKQKAGQLKYNESISAYERATTFKCKQEILEKAYKLETGALFDKISEDRRCPKRTYSLIGCTNDNVLKDFNIKLESTKHKFFVNNEKANTNECIQHCFTHSHKYAIFNHIRHLCSCYTNIPKHMMKTLVDQECGDDSKTKSKFQLYKTGFKEKNHWKIKYPTDCLNNFTDALFHKSVRIVFLLNVNGRSVRQILRLFKMIYQKNHFYFFYVDPVG